MRDVVIWDSSHRDYFIDLPVDWIEDYDTYLAYDRFYDADRIFVRAELSWTTLQKTSAYPGFELLFDLRKKQVRCPIFICSWLPRRYYLQLGLKPFGFLRLLHAHPFIQLPCAIKEYAALASAEPLTSLQLQDAITHFGDPHGVVEEQLHYLKNRLSVDGPDIVHPVFGQIEGVILRGHTEQLSRLKIDFLHALRQANGADHFKLINELKPKIEALLPSAEDQLPYRPPAVPWRVLYVEDQERIGQELREKLVPHRIHCVLAHSGKEAIKILKEDFSPKYQDGQPISSNTWMPNSITVVICDLRFETLEQNWQPMQGYDIIKTIYEQLPNFVSFIVLSAKRNALADLRHTLKHVRWRGFQKESIFSTTDNSGFEIFTDHIRQEGNEVFDILYNLPKAKAWYEPWKGKINAPLHLYYRVFRMSKAYLPKEYWIGECARSFIYEAELVADSLFPNKHEIGGLGFSTQFKAGLPDEYPSSNSKSMEHFYTKLIGRRIAIGLHLKEWSIDDISNIMKKGILTDDMADRQLFNSYLALSTDLKSEIPANLLVEERIWLENTMGFSLSLDHRYFFAALQEIIAGFQDKLREAGATADFLDEEILIGNERDARAVIENCLACCRPIGNMEQEFLQTLRELFEQKRYQPVAKKFYHFNISAP